MAEAGSWKSTWIDFSALTAFTRCTFDHPAQQEAASHQQAEMLTFRFILQLTNGQTSLVCANGRDEVKGKCGEGERTNLAITFGVSGAAKSLRTAAG